MSGTPLSTTNTNQPGQVLIKNEDGTMYLSTETVETSTGTAKVVVTRSPFRSLLSRTEVQIPEGYATNAGALINGVLSFVMVIAAMLVFFYLIWGGFEWITSGGDKGTTEKARSKITAAVLGLIIVSSAYAILSLVLNFLGFSGLNDVFQNAGTVQGGASQSAQRRNLNGTSELGELNQASPSPSASPAYIIE